MSVAYGITALIVGCVLLEVHRVRHLDRVARRERRRR